MGRTRLHELAGAGDLAGLTAALDAGELDIDEHDHNGETPLMTALRNDHPEAAALLLDRGASVSAADLGGNRAHDYAYAHLEIRARIESMGGVSGRTPAASMTLPFDRDDFEPELAMFLDRFRAGSFITEPDAEVMALLDPEPPPDLAALIHTWGHTPRSNFEQCGEYWIESRALDRAPDHALALIWGEAGGAHGVVIGSDPSGHVLVIASWRPGDDRARVDAFDDEGFAEPIGRLGDL